MAVRPQSKEENDLSDIFMKIYANLPIHERNQVVIVLKDQPISWTMAYNEIIHKTDLGNAILIKLRELDII